MRSPAATVASGKKMKFEGEPKKPPSYVRLVSPFMCLISGYETVPTFFFTFVFLTCSSRNGYQKFSQEMLSNGELNHLPMKERMAEIGSRWQSLPLKEKDRYKKIAEEKQRQYKVQLEQWLAVRRLSFMFDVVFSAGQDVCFLTSPSADPQSLSSQERNTYKEYNSQVSRSFYSSSQHVWRHAGLRFY